MKKFWRFIKKKENLTEDAKEICDVYRPNPVSVSIQQILFNHFPSENFDVKDVARSGRAHSEYFYAIFEKLG